MVKRRVYHRWIKSTCPALTRKRKPCHNPASTVSGYCGPHHEMFLKGILPSAGWVTKWEEASRALAELAYQLAITRDSMGVLEDEGWALDDEEGIVVRV